MLFLHLKRMSVYGLILGHLVGGLYKLWTYFKSVEEYLTQIYFKYNKHREKEREGEEERATSISQ